MRHVLRAPGGRSEVTSHQGEEGGLKLTSGGGSRKTQYFEILWGTKGAACAILGFSFEPKSNIAWCISCSLIVVPILWFISFCGLTFLFALLEFEGLIRS